MKRKASSLPVHRSAFRLPRSADALLHGRATALSLAPLVNQRGDEARPARLMRRAEAHAGVAVVVLVEEQEVAPVRVVLEFGVPAVDGASARFVACEEANEGVGEAARNLVGLHFGL